MVKNKKTRKRYHQNTSVKTRLFPPKYFFIRTFCVTNNNILNTGNRRKKCIEFHAAISASGRWNFPTRFRRRNNIKPSVPSLRPHLSNLPIPDSLDSSRERPRSRVNHLVVPIIALVNNTCGPLEPLPLRKPVRFS